MAGPWEKYAAPAEAGPWAKYAPAPANSAAAGPDIPGDTEGNMGQALLRGFNRVVGTVGDALYKVLPTSPRTETQRQEFKRFNAELDAANSGPDGKPLPMYQLGDVGGQVVTTAPVGGALGVAAKAGGLVRLGNALASGGASTGAPAAATLGGRAADMGIRMGAGGAIGGVSAGMVDPSNAPVGMAIGAALPPVARVAAYAGNALGGMVKPFFANGQEAIVGDLLNKTARDPMAALNALRTTRSPVPGSAPTATMAAGDEGLSGLQRTMQSHNGDYAANLAAHEAEQNAARSRYIESIAGNPGKISAAEQTRDKATAAMRDSVLTRAGDVKAQPVLDAIDFMRADPDNAGKLAQQALGQFRDQIEKASANGSVNARALYAIRKDVNDLLQGKLSGDAGNLRYASGQLSGVKGIIDDAIHEASTRTGTAVMPYGANIERAGMAPTAQPTWKDYLSKYSEMSKPIDQMKALEDVLKRVQNGTVDKLGNAQLSAAKLNNILKNEGADLNKTLTPDQMDVLRRVQADLNASQLAANSGRAVGSNTVQNLAGGNALNALLGGRFGGSTLASATLGRALQLPYGIANQQIGERVGNALLDPQVAARLMQQRAGRPDQLLNLLNDAALPAASRVAPLLPGNGQR